MHAVARGWRLYRLWVHERLPLRRQVYLAVVSLISGAAVGLCTAFFIPLSFGESSSQPFDTGVLFGALAVLVTSCIIVYTWRARDRAGHSIPAAPSATSMSELAAARRENRPPVLEADQRDLVDKQGRYMKESLSPLVLINLIFGAASLALLLLLVLLGPEIQLTYLIPIFMTLLSLPSLLHTLGSNTLTLSTTSE